MATTENSSDLSLGGGPCPNLMSLPWLPFSIPFIHTPPKSLFTKRRGTYWEPNPTPDAVGVKRDSGSQKLQRESEKPAFSHLNSSSTIEVK